ncbi:hypothetical protein ACOME3_007141 [Neoechinorhynchus agilis]
MESVRRDKLYVGETRVKVVGKRANVSHSAHRSSKLLQLLNLSKSKQKMNAEPHFVNQKHFVDLSSPREDTIPNLRVFVVLFIRTIIQIVPNKPSKSWIRTVCIFDRRSINPLMLLANVKIVV